MNLELQDVFVLLVALLAIITVGSREFKQNVYLFAMQTGSLSIATALYGVLRHEDHLCAIAAALFFFKAIAVPWFLIHVANRVGVRRDSGSGIPMPLAMHIALAFFAVSYILAKQLPVPPGNGLGWPGAAASISLVCTGLIIMLTRRNALSQILGFLVMENGIYTFGLTQTIGMPLLVEMGIMLDVLVAVMIGGLLAFRIKESFEHIDVTMLAELKE